MVSFGWVAVDFVLWQCLLQLVNLSFGDYGAFFRVTASLIE